MTPADIGSVWAPRLLSVLRIMAALLFIQHGAQKLFGFPVAPPRGMPELGSLLWFGAIIELVGGALIAVGFFTRPVAFLASGMCAAAYFLFHAGRGFYPIVNQGELVALYCFVFLYISAAGPGPWSVDAMMGRSRGVSRWA